MFRRMLGVAVFTAMTLIVVGGLWVSPSFGQACAPTCPASSSVDRSSISIAPADLVPAPIATVTPPADTATNRPGVLRRDEAVVGASTITALAGMGTLLITLGLIVRRRRAWLRESQPAPVATVPASTASSTVRA